MRYLKLNFTTCLSNSLVTLLFDWLAARYVKPFTLNVIFKGLKTIAPYLLPRQITGCLKKIC